MSSAESGVPLALRVLARTGGSGHALAARLDLLRSLGPRPAWLRRRDEKALARLSRPGHAIYESIWRDAARDTGAELALLEDNSIEISRGERRVRVRRQVVPLDDSETLRLALDKPRVHRLLEAEGLPVPEHVEIDAGEPAAALGFLERCGRCVVKPAVGTSGGLGVTAGVETPAQLERALLFASRYAPRLLIERHVAGSMYRLLFLDRWLLDTVRRGPPRITGDGRSSVAELISRENRRRLDAGARRELLRMDLECLFALERAGLHPRSVLPADSTVAVKFATSQGSGADAETIHERLSEALVAEARAAVEASGLRLAGVDLIAEDLRGPLTQTGGAILEVNGTPGLDYHYDVADPEGAVRVAVPVLRRLLSQEPAEHELNLEPLRADSYEEVSRP